MTWQGMRRTFSHLFSDEDSGRMVPLATALADSDVRR